MGERVEAGERKEESNQSTKRKKKKKNTVPSEPTVHENIVKYLRAMLFYMT